MSEEDEFLSMGASGAEHLQGRTAGSRRWTEAGVVSAFWVLAVLMGGSRHRTGVGSGFSSLPTPAAGPPFTCSFAILASAG